MRLPPNDATDEEWAAFLTELSTNPGLETNDGAAANSSIVDYGVFGSSSSDKTAESKPGALQNFVNKVMGTLGKVIEDAESLEVRTYVSSNLNVATGLDREKLSQVGTLRAFTRISLDGDMDVCVPETDGVVDAALWVLHLEMVKQAQAQRAEMVKSLVSLVTNFVKI